MIIEIQGTSTVNKGAWLMHRAVEAGITRKWPNAKIVVKRRGFKLDEIRKFKYGWYVDNELLKKVPLLNAFKVLPSSLRKLAGVYLAEDIDIKFDASGYIIGDNWDIKYVKSRFSDMDGLKSSCLKVMLPQAFGPFNKVENESEYASILRKFDLVFARDPLSLDYINKVVDRKDIQYFPDFTNLLKPSKVENHGDVCLIPNCKLYESGKITRDQVIEMFVDFIESFQSKGLSVFFLMHEGPKDLALSNDINKMLPKPIAIVDPQDPLKIKSVIAGSKFVVTGRFHGLASSLSTLVPSISLSWSHKYKMLMNLYGIDDSYIVSKVLNKDEINAIVDSIFANEQFYKQTLTRNSKEVEEKSSQMWDIIYNKA